MLRPSLIAAALALAVSLSGTARGADPNEMLPEDAAKPLVVRTCTSCHQAAQVIAKHRTAEEWDEMVGKMVDRGAQANETEQQQIADYLTRYFGPAPSAAPAPTPGK